MVTASALFFVTMTAVLQSLPMVQAIMLLDIITTSLYLGLPMLWSGMMARAGVNIGRSITAATLPFARPADDAGPQGGSLGRMAISKGINN